MSNNSLIYSKIQLTLVLKIKSNVFIHVFLHLLYPTFVKRKWRNSSWAQLPLVAKMGNLCSLFWGKEWGGAGGLASYQFLSYQQRQVHGLINYIDTIAKCYYLKNWPVKGLCGRCLSVWGHFYSKVFVWGGVHFCRFWNWLDTESQTPAQYDLQQNPVPLPPLHTVYILIHTGKEGGGRVEPERRLEEQQFKRLGRKYQHDWMYLQFVNSDKHLPQSPITGQVF